MVKSYWLPRANKECGEILNRECGEILNKECGEMLNTECGETLPAALVDGRGLVYPGDLVDAGDGVAPDVTDQVLVVADHLTDLRTRCLHLRSNCREPRGRKEMFYLTTHSTHFIYGYMASDIW